MPLVLQILLVIFSDLCLLPLYNFTLNNLFLVVLQHLCVSSLVLFVAHFRSNALFIQLHLDSVYHIFRYRRLLYLIFCNLVLLFFLFFLDVFVFLCENLLFVLMLLSKDSLFKCIGPVLSPLLPLDHFLFPPEFLLLKSARVLLLGKHVLLPLGELVHLLAVLDLLGVFEHHFHLAVLLHLLLLGLILSV